MFYLWWELVCFQEPLHRRRRENGLNSTHIFSVKSATACTEVTVTGKMSIGPPKGRCRRILWIHYLHCIHCMDEYIHETEVQLTPVDLQRGKVRTLL